MISIKELNDLEHAKQHYPKLFSPFKIKNYELPNKLVFPPWGLNYTTEDGFFTEKLYKFYEDLANGGCSLVITGAALTSKNCIGRGSDRYMRLYDDKWIEDYKKLFDLIKASGALAGLQLGHQGRQHPFPGFGNDALLAPSAIPIPQLYKKNPAYKVKAMTLEEVEECKLEFVEAAVRAYKAGVDYIEIHGANGFLITNFLSPRANHRTDRYGGSIKNRTRFLAEIIKETKKRTNDEIIIAARLAISELVDDGLQPEHYKEILPILEEAGVDIIHGSVGTTTENLDRNIPVAKYGDMPNVDIIAKVKEYTKLPLINVGSIMTCKNGEMLLNEGKADLIAIGRPLLADPNLIKLSAEGKEDSIRLCTRCNFCMTSKRRSNTVYCKVNPDYQMPEGEKLGNVY